MNTNNVLFKCKLSTVCLFIALLILGLTTPVRSQLATAKTSLPDSIVFRANFDPPGDPEPKKGTSGGGSRDGSRCLASEQPIKPLMPKRNFGLTFEEHPSVFVYLPKTSAKRALLVFKDETGKYYEKTFIPITNSGGIVSFTQPKDKPPLSVGKNYQWSVVIICGSNVQPDDPTFNGWVQRVEKTSEINRELSEKNAIWKAKWYGERGYWYDMLMSMHEVKKDGLKDIKSETLFQIFWRSMGVD
ncbi:MAG: DUF928 domain-containing protein [Scytonematopsis contorta HA4267-MV1]|jgi:hypothetical protein|nr:DUF928 domain-containing protein [Scytonematopsis contorta HA4267-MV1]